MTLPTDSVCYRALSVRDSRFDGRLFVGVTSTGIYCRPICPARTAKPEHCRFFPSAAAAQDAGFRPCLRCRPELSPDAAAWRGTSNTVSRALALIAEGALDGDEAGVAARAVDGVERVDHNRYGRTLAIGDAVGSVDVAPGRDCLLATIRLSHIGALLSVVARLRRLFDLDANVEVIGAHLKCDAALAPLI